MMTQMRLKHEVTLDVVELQIPSQTGFTQTSALLRSSHGGCFVQINCAKTNWEYQNKLSVNRRPCEGIALHKQSVISASGDGSINNFRVLKQLNGEVGGGPRTAEENQEKWLEYLDIRKSIPISFFTLSSPCFM